MIEVVNVEHKPDNVIVVTTFENGWTESHSFGGFNEWQAIAHAVQMHGKD